MIVDTHCHFDMMPNPEGYIQQVECRGDIVIGMTNLPSHYQLGIKHVVGYNHVRLALGFHPQLVEKAVRELPLFCKYIDSTSYIGEIGLDYSARYVKTRELQIKCLKEILSLLSNKNKIVSVHSRMAEEELFRLLQDYQIKNVIFHWYSGKLSLMQKIIDEGYYFSINEAMTMSASGRKIISKIPVDRLLTESDAPFNGNCDIKRALDNIKVPEEQILYNFNRLLGQIRK